MITGVAATRQGIRILYLFVKLIDMPISKLTKGSFIPSANGSIMPVYYLTTIGAKSQTLRSVPVLCVPDRDRFILVGSNWGQSHNPSWVYNLRANPRAQLRKGQIQIEYVATELCDGNREAYWRKAIGFYPPYASYEQRSGRLLPIFLLEGEADP